MRWSIFLQTKEETVQRLAREMEKLVNADFYNIQPTQESVRQLQGNFSAFMERLNNRKKLLTETMAFFRNGSKVNNVCCNKCCRHLVFSDYIFSLSQPLSLYPGPRGFLSLQRDETRRDEREKEAARENLW